MPLVSIAKQVCRQVYVRSFFFRLQYELCRNCTAAVCPENRLSLRSQIPCWISRIRHHERLSDYRTQKGAVVDFYSGKGGQCTQVHLLTYRLGGIMWTRRYAGGEVVYFSDLIPRENLIAECFKIQPFEC